MAPGTTRERAPRAVSGGGQDAATVSGGGQVITVLNALTVIAHSQTRQAARRGSKKMFGLHPMTARADHRAGGSGEPVPTVPRPGTPGAAPPPINIGPNGTKSPLAR